MMSSRALCCSMLHALIILFAIGATESFNTHKFASRQPSSSPLPSSLSDESNENSIGEYSSVNDQTRRRGGRLLFQSMLVGALPLQSFSQIVHAEEKKEIFVTGRVSLPSGMTTDSLGDAAAAKPALYITARPNRPDNVRKAILDGTRGKSPPVLIARFESPVFPFDFKLGSKDLTAEGVGDSDQQSATKDGTFWWSADDLIISARWDNDGVAATRSPDDLVGKNVWKQGSTGFVLDLQGRGPIGKLATKKS